MDFNYRMHYRSPELFLELRSSVWWQHCVDTICSSKAYPHPNRMCTVTVPFRATTPFAQSILFSQMGIYPKKNKQNSATVNIHSILNIVYILCCLRQMFIFMFVPLKLSQNFYHKTACLWTVLPFTLKHHTVIMWYLLDYFTFQTLLCIDVLFFS